MVRLLAEMRSAWRNQAPREAAVLYCGRAAAVQPPLVPVRHPALPRHGDGRPGHPAGGDGGVRDAPGGRSTVLAGTRRGASRGREGARAATRSATRTLAGLISLRKAIARHYREWYQVGARPWPDRDHRGGIGRVHAGLRSPASTPATGSASSNRATPATATRSSRWGSNRWRSRSGRRLGGLPRQSCVEAAGPLDGLVVATRPTPPAPCSPGSAWRSSPPGATSTACS